MSNSQTGRSWQLEIAKSELSNTRITPNRWASSSLADGQARVEVDTFAMTANNATYAVFGEAMAYWQFFPSSDSPNWGIVPVWGFAKVIETNHPELAIGQRFYGYWPSGSHLVVGPAKVTASGFVDDTEHRRNLPAVYNSYAKVADQTGEPDPIVDALQSLFRPLLTTSFFIDDFLSENDFYGASQVIIASASSKTAMALAFCLDRRGIRTVGLTSDGNVEFVRGLGWYQDVITYRQLAAEDPPPALTEPSVYVDMSGDAKARAKIHQRCTDLRFDLMVGATHWDAASLESTADLPGPTPEFFFAPTQIAKRAKEWGSDGMAARTATSWDPFITEVNQLLTIQQRHGSTACQDAYLAALDGTADPAIGVIIQTR